MQTTAIVRRLLILSGSTVFLLTMPARGAFVPASAAYYGLFYETNSYWEQSSGTLSLRTTTRGSYSARLQVGPRSYSLTGHFDAEGRLSGSIPRPNDTPLTLQAQVDPQDSDLISGTVSGGTWTAELFADRAVFDGKNMVSYDAGRYTTVLYGDPSSTNSPGGHSHGTVVVSKTGRLQFAGSLADGTKVTQSSMVSKDGYWPFYISLYSGYGAVYGWLSLNSSTNEDISGDVAWVKTQLASEWYYPDGFGLFVTATGSRYTPPPHGIRIVNLPAVEIQFNGGNLSQNFTNHLTLDSNNRIANQSANGLQVTFSPANGSFRGRVQDPGSFDWIPFRGVILQSFGVGAGYFSGWDQTGEVWIEGD